MNRLFQPTDNTMLFRLSRNAESYKADKGKFEVNYSQHSTRVFYTLLEAFLFYITIEEDAELWDRTGKNVLVEKKVKFHLN